MDKDMLRQYESMKREIEELRQRIGKNRERLDKMENKYSAADVVSGGEGGTRHFKVEGFPYPEYERQKSYLYARQLRLEKLEKKVSGLTDEVEESIAAVGSSRMRRILMFRYIDLLTWGEIAERMGKGNTADALRKEHDRFLDKSRKCV